MRFARFAQLNHEKRWRRAAALLLALSMLFSFLPVSLIDAVDESEAVISEPNETASSEATVPASDRTDAADTNGIATAPAETDAPETTVPATAAPGAPTTEPTEPAAPPTTTESTGTAAPAETTETASSRETTETAASAGTTNPADTTAPAGTTATTVTAAPAAPNADDKALGLFASDTTAQNAATITCYAPWAAHGSRLPCCRPASSTFGR